MNVAVENCHRAKLLQIGESLRAVLGAPAPLGIYSPQRDVRENDDGRAGLEMLDVFFHPFQLIVAQRAEPARFEIRHIDQANEMNAFLFEAVPAIALRTFAV